MVPSTTAAPFWSVGSEEVAMFDEAAQKAFLYPAKEEQTQWAMPSAFTSSSCPEYRRDVWASAAVLGL